MIQSLRTLPPFIKTTLTMRYIEIDEDRYSGIYSGAAFTAWDGEQPSEIDAGDPTCEKFWETNKRVCGKGPTAQSAAADLLTKLGDDAWFGWFRAIVMPQEIIIPNDARHWPLGWEDVLQKYRFPDTKNSES